MDVVVGADSMADVERLVRDLRARGYTDVAPPMRFRDEAGVLVDVIPYGEALAPAGRLTLPGDIDLRVEGFSRLMPDAVHIELIPGLKAVVAPLPLYAMLKLAAYTDRRKVKDLNGFLHCARYYEDVEESERRYGLEHAGEMTPLEFGGAFHCCRRARASVPPSSVRACLMRPSKPARSSTFRADARRSASSKNLSILSSRAHASTMAKSCSRLSWTA